MAALGVVVKALLALGLLLAIARAFGGAPPAQPRPAAARLALGLAAAAATVAATGAYAGAGWAAAPAAVAVLAASLAGWFSRGPEGGGPDAPPAPESPPPVDWDAFDRARAGWSRPRVPVR
jgi:hypothetical protein